MHENIILLFGGQTNLWADGSSTLESMALASCWKKAGVTTWQHWAKAWTTYKPDKKGDMGQLTELLEHCGLCIMPVPHAASTLPCSRFKLSAFVELQNTQWYFEIVIDARDDGVHIWPLSESTWLTLSLLRVINVKFPLQPHQKYYITQ